MIIDGNDCKFNIVRYKLASLQVLLVMPNVRSGPSRLEPLNSK